ncbi:MAG: FG-GAP-like repeat-containing protein [Actinomycetota bacterium]|nr:FG-GAP-like repeat-containing protein [Actinomycetota bacterium]
MRGIRSRAWAVVAVLALVASGGPAVEAAATNANLPPTFASAKGYPVGSWPKSVVVGDFTGDGLPDAVVGTGWVDDPVNDNKLFLFSQAASGALNPPVRLTTGARSSSGFEEEMGMDAGDLDGDGRTDLVLATYAGVEVFLQRSGSLVRSALVELAEAEQVNLVDLDGDTDLDLVVDRRISVDALANTGAGSFGPATRVGGFGHREIETGDVTGDGRVDIVGISGAVVQVSARRADGTFADPASYTVADTASGLAVGDFNADGRRDVAVSHGVSQASATVQVLLQTPAGTLGGPSSLEAFSVPGALVAADMNLDGRTDLVALHDGAAGVFTQGPDGNLGTEDMHLALSARYFLPKALAVGDVSGDGFPDIVMADRSNGLAVLRSSGQVRSWGFSGFGQLGDGAKVDRPRPTAPVAMPQTVDVSAGGYHNLAVTRDGRAWAWGLNHVGQLGNGSTAERTTPVQVPGLNHVAGVGAGAFHSLAFTDDGTVRTWGWNYFGQLGDGSKTDRSTPTLVPGLTGVVAVAGGATHSLALRQDGTVWAWGLGHAGQLGTGSTTSSLVPVQVRSLANIVAISAGLYHNLALDEAGQVWAWGFNDWGQLGTDVDAIYDPVPRIAMDGATGIAAGAHHSVAVYDFTEVYAWGLNHVGQLGDGTTVSRTVPTRSHNPDQIVGVIAGWYHTVAVAITGTTSAWGWNYFGQLGNGTTANALRPVRVPSIDPTAMSAGVGHTVAVTARGA